MFLNMHKTINIGLFGFFTLCKIVHKIFFKLLSLEAEFLLWEFCFLNVNSNEVHAFKYHVFLFLHFFGD